MNGFNALAAEAQGKRPYGASKRRAAACANEQNKTETKHWPTRSASWTAIINIQALTSPTFSQRRPREFQSLGLIFSLGNLLLTARGEFLIERINSHRAGASIFLIVPFLFLVFISIPLSLYPESACRSAPKLLLAGCMYTRNVSRRLFVAKRSRDCALCFLCLLRIFTYVFRAVSSI